MTFTILFAAVFKYVIRWFYRNGAIRTLGNDFGIQLSPSSRTKRRWPTTWGFRVKSIAPERMFQTITVWSRLSDLNIGRFRQKSWIQNFTKGNLVVTGPYSNLEFKSSVTEITRHVWSNWPNEWAEERVERPDILRLIFQVYISRVKQPKIWVSRVVFCTTTWHWTGSDFRESGLQCIYCPENAYQVRYISQFRLFLKQTVKKCWNI